jgi:predicted RNase H-like HicB family nuclease
LRRALQLARCIADGIIEFMNTGYTAIIKQDADWWVGWIEEVPGVNAQERTRAELLDALAQALADILELNREEARREIAGEYEEVPMPM